ncbi:hypothetical protein Scep_008029 [Stephania cephalantha]|uniref:Uncharacterized protein n=1 Tax=Stephania cephalantha TaxID=152367 RepID=A0AAP0PMB6_9MAGN
MILSPNHHLARSPSHPTLAFFHKPQQRLRRRRRLNLSRPPPPPPLSIRSSASDFLDTFLSQIPSALSRLGLTNRASRGGEIGDWILVASPTPFNRFVLLRCPSISVEEGDRLVEEERHFVRLDSGRIRLGLGLRDLEDGSAVEGLVFQRVCVGTDDGGVISLDWPASLDLREERGMDTTVLLVPGTAEGSGDLDVKAFVCDSLRRGCFPIVVNPRGCAGSPLTTARLFTAADSDDVCTAIQFINKARPWTTLMGVGWGHGANMLTKYLAEVGERTPLTAAACIDNPFDLEEATRSFPHRMAVDQKLTSGLIEILRSNKELFQGRAKGFNVDKALSATSLRDFEKEISMVSHGFNDIEDFYSKSSTRELIDNVKIPIYCLHVVEVDIQALWFCMYSDSTTVPPFSIPRSSIAANPFTSLLLCSCLRSSLSTSERSVISWSQHFSIEWLAAVELALLKGRHPLLKDVDVTFNLSKGLVLTEGRESGDNIDEEKLLHLSKLNTFNGYSVDSIKHKLNGRDVAANIPFLSRANLLKKFESQKRGFDAELLKVESEGSVPDDQSQVLQTTQVVINMLDVTMPGALGEEQKKKVLTAVAQGETLIRAFEGAVPGDARGKLTAAVSGFLQAQGTNLSIGGIKKVGQINNASPEAKLKIQETGATGVNKDGYSSEQMQKGSDQSLVGVDGNELGMEKHAEELDLQSPPSQELQKSLDQSPTQPESTHADDVSASGRKDINDSERNYTKAEYTKEESAQTSKNDDTGSGREGDPNKLGKTDKKAGSEDVPIDQDGNHQGNGVAKGNTIVAKDIHAVEQTRADPSTDTNKPNPITRADEKSAHLLTEQNKPSSTTGADEKSTDASSEQNKMSPTITSDETVPRAVSATEPSPMEQQGTDIQKGENSPKQEGLSNQSSIKSDKSFPFISPNIDPPSVGVSQALDALTSFDDSTQMAVNNIFEVIENMIGQLEEDSEPRNEESKNVVDDEDASAPEGTRTVDEIKGKTNKEASIDSAMLQTNGYPVKDGYDEIEDHQDGNNGSIEKQWSQSCDLFSKRNNSEDHGSIRRNHLVNDGKMRLTSLAMPKSLVNGSNKIEDVHEFPPCTTVGPYGGLLYSQCLRQYLQPKMSNEKALDIDSTTDLLLDYFPEEGQWKLLDQTGNSEYPVGDIEASGSINGSEKLINSSSHGYGAHEAIEPSYIILDTENDWQPVEEYKIGSNDIEKPRRIVRRKERMLLIRNLTLDSLKVEVGRKLGFDKMKNMDPNLTQDLEKVADAVAVTVTWHLESKAFASGKADTIHVEHIIETISSVVKDATYLTKILPIGLIVGSTLASLRNYVSVLEQLDDVNLEGLTQNKTNNVRENFEAKASEMQKDLELDGKKDQHSYSNSSVSKISESREGSKSDAVVAGAVTAALGASALLMHQQSKDLYERSQTPEVSFMPQKEKGTHQKEHDKLLDAMSEKNQSNIMTSLAEKAMSVAGPIVPTNSEGEVDQDRLVAMLADLVQKGGMLRLVGKVALLWGGIRGAMSLTDRLISFLRIAERPLYQRVFGFACMVLVLWSPVVIPLFPTLVQSWATHNSNGITEYAAIMGLYIAVIILIMLWGKRIRGYSNPVEQYGLDLASLPKLLDVLKGLIGGVMLVSSVHTVNAFLGYAHFSWPWDLRSSLPDALSWLKAYGGLIVLAIEGIVTATIVSVVEELLFRSWLPEEIATDLGYHQGIIISGLAFAILQRSLHAIPGLWLLALVLSGIRQRSEGSLSIPIGIRTGILASSFVLKTGGFLTYHPTSSIWLIGRHPLQIFGGAIGQAVCVALAILLYPRQPLEAKESRVSLGRSRRIKVRYLVDTTILLRGFIAK